MDEAAGAEARPDDVVRIGTEPADLDVDWIHAALSKRAGAPIGPAGWQVSRCYTPAVPGIERTVVEPCPG
jgi:hypothetical protein